MTSPDFPHYERGVCPNEIVFNYGEAVLHINSEADDGIKLVNPSLTLTLGEFRETIPYKDQIGTFQVRVSKYLDTSYFRRFNLITYDINNLQSRYGASAFFEEIQHESLHPLIDQQLMNMKNRLPEFMQAFPRGSYEYLNKNRANLKARASEDYQRKGMLGSGIEEFLYLQELVAKKQTFQEMLQWSHGDLTRIISSTPESITSEEVERDYFEWLYLTLITTDYYNTNNLQGVLDRSLGVPFALQEADKDFRNATDARIRFLETGLVEGTSKFDEKKSWLPEEHTSTELYQYFIAS